jgi:hypothetical protein
MNVELNLEELELIVEALDQKHDALSSGRLFSKNLAFSKIDQQHISYENGRSSVDSLQDIGGNVQQ